MTTSWSSTVAGCCGRRSAADVTAVSQVVIVEVDERADELVTLLREAGLDVRQVGRLLEIDLRDDAMYDVVRDTVVAAGLGLIRMERRRHRMAEIFATARAEGDADAA